MIENNIKALIFVILWTKTDEILKNKGSEHLPSIPFFLPIFQFFISMSNNFYPYILLNNIQNEIMFFPLMRMVRQKEEGLI